MEDGCSEGGIGLAFGQNAHKIVRLPGPARSDYGNVRRAGDGSRERAIETLLNAVGVHGSEKNLAGPERFAAGGPLDGIYAFIIAPSTGIDVPCTGLAPACVDGEHDGLRAELMAQLGD